MSPFEKNVERDARLVLTAMVGGFQAVCSQAMHMEEFKGGPDRVLEHADWLKSQDDAYIMEVSTRAAELEAQAA